MSLFNFYSKETKGFALIKNAEYDEKIFLKIHQIISNHIIAGRSK